MIHKTTIKRFTMMETSNLTYPYYFQIAHSMFTVLSNLMAVDDAVLEEADKNGSVTKDLIHIIDSYATTAKLPPNGTITINTDNLALETKEAYPTTFTGFADGLSYPPLGMRNFGSDILSNIGGVTQVCYS